MTEKKLYRSCDDRILGGVAAGLGEYFSIDRVIIRLIFVIATFPGGVGVILYLIAWLIIPNDPKCKEKNKEAKEEIKESAEIFANKVKETVETTKPDQGKTIVGIIIILAGGLLLLHNLIGMRFWMNFWPLALILIGILIIYNSTKTKEKK